MIAVLTHQEIVADAHHVERELQLPHLTALHRRETGRGLSVKGEMGDAMVPVVSDVHPCAVHEELPRVEELSCLRATGAHREEPLPLGSEDLDAMVTLFRDVYLIAQQRDAPGMAEFAELDALPVLSGKVIVVPDTEKEGEEPFLHRGKGVRGCLNRRGRGFLPGRHHRYLLDRKSTRLNSSH